MDMELIREEILQGLLQVDSSFVLTSFNAELDKTTRKLTVTFTAQNDSGAEISSSTDYE